MKNLSWRTVRYLGTFLSFSALVWWITKQNWESLWLSFAHLPLFILIAAWSLYWLGLVLNASRWYVILRGMGIVTSRLRVLQLTLAGAFASNFLPSTVGGDALRISGLLGQQISTARVVTSVLLDRLFNVAAMYSFLPLTWATYGGSVHTVFSKASHPAALAWGMRLRIPHQWQANLKEAKEGLNTLRHTPHAVIVSLSLSWLSLIPPFTATWLIARSLGIPIAWYEVAGTTVLTYTITLLPIAINGYGVREVAVVTLYSLLGATGEQALTLAVVTRFLMALATFTGVFWVGKAIPDASS